MLDITIAQIQLFLPFIEYRESNIEYLLATSSEAYDQQPSARDPSPVTSNIAFYAKIQY
jgi:hypothetical protein